uniref:(northern house mosquito) hypothetical protein n=1 Tax=Culex pipiens TaxID=7175 RepID=A0A8D8HPY7_CULPI
MLEIIAVKLTNDRPFLWCSRSNLMNRFAAVVRLLTRSCNALFMMFCWLFCLMSRLRVLSIIRRSSSSGLPAMCFHAFPIGFHLRCRLVCGLILYKVPYNLCFFKSMSSYNGL